MGCGCNKNKVGITGPEFRTKETESLTKSIFAQKMSMVKSFASAIASRGLSNNKVNKATKQLRVLSCFGNQQQGGVLPPCEYLKESSTPGKHFCGGCGCGDKSMTWLVAEGQEYSKLDYPNLNCPLNMPGFTNYQPATPDEGEPPITRRHYIENIDYNVVMGVAVSLPDKPQPTNTEQSTETLKEQS
jgi:hypothetical protein